MKNILMVLLFFILVGCCVSPPDAVYFSVYNDKGESSGISFSTTDGLSVEDLSIEPYAVALFELDNPGGCFWKKEREFEKVVINGKEIGSLSPSGCLYSPMVCFYIIRGDSVFLRQIEYSDYGINGDGESLDLYKILKSKPKFGEYKILHEYK